MVANNILSARNLIPEIVTGKGSDKLFEMVHNHVEDACDRASHSSQQVLSMFSCGGKGFVMQRFSRCKERVANRMADCVPDTLTHIERYMDSAMDLETLLTAKMKELAPKEFEQFLHPVFEEDEWKLVLMGGVLGIVIGFFQAYALGL